MKSSNPEKYINRYMLKVHPDKVVRHYPKLDGDDLKRKQEEYSERCKYIHKALNLISNLDFKEKLLAVHGLTSGIKSRSATVYTEENRHTLNPNRGWLLPKAG
jgi:hypothetical protein